MMLKTRRSRGVFVGVLFALTLLIGFGLLGYFVGFESYGAGWTGFYVGAIIAATSILGAAIFIGLFGLLMRWVYKGKES
jgi:hypothetical protein